MTANPFGDETLSSLASDTWRNLTTHSPAALEVLHKERRKRFLARLHDTTRGVVLEAEAKAERCSVDLLDSGHLLAGLTSSPSVAAEILREAGLGPADVRARLDRGFSDTDAEALASLGIGLDDALERARNTFGANAVSRGTWNGDFFAVRPSAEFMMIFVSAMATAKRMCHADLLPEHLLLAALVNPSLDRRPTKLTAILGAAGCDLDSLRASVGIAVDAIPATDTAGRRGPVSLGRFQRKLASWIARAAHTTERPDRSTTS